jgi:hypothetical protein
VTGGNMGPTTECCIVAIGCRALDVIRGRVVFFRLEKKKFILVLRAVAEGRPFALDEDLPDSFFFKYNNAAFGRRTMIDKSNTVSRKRHGNDLLYILHRYVLNWALCVVFAVQRTPTRCEKFQNDSFNNRAAARRQSLLYAKSCSFVCLHSHYCTQQVESIPYLSDDASRHIASASRRMTTYCT